MTVPVFNMTDLWNNTGVVWNAIKMDVTNTASAAGSRLLDLLVGSVSKFSVDKEGAATLAGDLTISKAAPSLYIDSTGTAAPDVGDLRFEKGGLHRWWMRGVQPQGEAGSNSGSNFHLFRWDDASTSATETLNISRATGVMTLRGDLTIDKASPTLALWKAAGAAAWITGNDSTGRIRHRITLAGSTVESGGNAGSDFNVTRYDDAGTAILGTPISITRGTGHIKLEHGDWASAGVEVIGQSVGSQLMVNTPPAGGVADVSFRKGGLGRWILRGCVSSSESGSSAGSDFQILRYNDAGGLQSTPFSIRRSDGTVALGTQAAGFYGTSADITVRSTTSRHGIHYQSQSAGGVANFAIFNSAAAALVGYIQVSDAATAFGTSSDARLKSNDTLFARGREIIDQLPIKDFTWVTTGTQDVGVMAQEVYGAYPAAVIQGRGEPGEEGFMPWGIDYSKYVPVLIQGLQDAFRQIDELRARVTALEAV